MKAIILIVEKVSEYYYSPFEASFKVAESG